MKRKFLFTLMLVALTVVLFAISVSAAEFLITIDDIHSMVSTGAETDWGKTEQLFDGNRNSASGWKVNNGWAGTKNTYLTITFKEEITINKFDIYCWTNWKPGYTMNFYNAQGVETHNVSVNGFNNMDGQAFEVPLPENPVKVQQIVLTRLDYGNDGYKDCFALVELDIYAEHSCNFTVPGDVITEPTCAMDGEQEYFCRCGETSLELIPATGEHSVSERVVYRDGFNYPGMIASACATCATLDEKIDDVPAMFTSLGYSACEFGKNGVTYGIFIDQEAIAIFNEYADENGEASIDFGIVAGSRSAFAEGNPLVIGASGVEKASNALAVKSFKYSEAYLASYSLNGFANEYKDTQLILSAYIYDGSTIYYLSGDVCDVDVVTISYNEVLSVAEPPMIEN